MKKTYFFKYTFIIFLFTLGLFVCAVGDTWCRYQTVKTCDIVYKVKGIGQYFISEQSTDWIYDNESGIYKYDFIISNTSSSLTDDEGNLIVPVTSHAFYVRFKTDSQINLYLSVLEESGREKLVQGIQNSEKEYVFYDEKGNEISFLLEGTKKSKQRINLILLDSMEPSLNEIIILDKAYKEVAINEYMVNQSKQLMVTSNFLSDIENRIVEISQATELTMQSNLNLTSKVTATTSSENIQVSLNGLNELDINLEANKEAKATLNWNVIDPTIAQVETISVSWHLFDASNQHIKTMKADFQIDLRTFESGEPLTEITYECMNEMNQFSKYEPLLLKLTSTKSGIVELGELGFPRYTKYSTNESDNWYMLSEPSKICVELVENVPMFIELDFSEAEMTWSNQDYSIGIYSNDIMISNISAVMKDEQSSMLEIPYYKMGVINKDSVSYTVNIEDIEFEIEFYNGENYEKVIKDDYFIIETPTNTTYVIKKKEGVDLPAGQYRIVIKQVLENQLIEQKELYFYAIEELEIENTNHTEEVQ